jgi:hypothetical protein
MEIKHYKTDISNWGQEDDELFLKGSKKYDNTYTFIEILNIANNHRAPIIIKTSYKSIEKPGHWYIKGTNNNDIPYDIIKIKLEENQANNKWSSRDCYLIKYL